MLVKYILFVCFVYVITCLTYVVILVRCKLLSDSCMKKARPDKASRQPLELRRRAFIRGGLVPCNETVNDRVQKTVDSPEVVIVLYSGKPTTSSDSEKLLAKPIELTTLVDVHQCNNLSSLFERNIMFPFLSLARWISVICAAASSVRLSWFLRSNLSRTVACPYSR